MYHNTLILLAILVVSPSAVFASDVTGNVGGTMATPIGITETRNFAFGHMTIPSVGTAYRKGTILDGGTSGSFTVDANGTDSVRLLTDNVFHPAKFDITAQAGQTLLLSAVPNIVPTGLALDQFNAVYDNGNTFEVNGSNTVLAIASAELILGMRVAISDNATPGDVNPGKFTYTLTAIYQ